MSTAQRDSGENETQIRRHIVSAQETAASRVPCGVNIRSKSQRDAVARRPHKAWRGACRGRLHRFGLGGGLIWALGGSWPQPVEPPSRSPRLLLAWGRVSQGGPCRNWGRARGTAPNTFPHHPESYFSSTSAQDALPEASCAGLEESGRCCLWLP